MGKLQAAIISVLFAPLVVCAQQAVINITEAQAASHRLRGAVPEYPAFSKAAEIEGTVALCTQISADGHVQGMFPITGPPSLREAAEKSLQQSLYKPFQIDGKPTAVRAWLKVRFQLPAGIEARTYPTPKLSPANYDPSKNKDALSIELSSLSPKLRRWLRKSIAEDIDGELSPPERDLAVEAAFRATQVYALPGREPGTHLYLFKIQSELLCGDGNCPWMLVEQRGADILLAADSGGWGFALYQRPGASFPDVLFASHMSAFETEIDGYREAGGIWGQLYADVAGKRPGDEPPSPFLCKP